jgi:hypothetical protein
VLPCIVHGLADENEVVRDAAMQAGRVMVDAYAGSSMALLLPAIEDGIAQSNWRIRSSAVELLGNLMFKIAGTSGNIRLDGGSDDEGASTEAQGRAIVEKLGMARRNEVRVGVVGWSRPPCRGVALLCTSLCTQSKERSTSQHRSIAAQAQSCQP